MSTITLTQDYGYSAYRVSGLAAGTVIDASAASWILDNDSSDGASSAYPVLVYSAPNVVIEGGTILGNIDQTSDWTEVYAMGNSAAVRTEDAPGATISDWRISNAWDAVRVSWNSPDFVIQGIWATDIRDDAVEDDRLQSGTIHDSLFDGAFGGISIDPDESNPVDGHNETVVIDGVLLRLQRSLYEGEMTHSSFIKTDSATDGTVTPNLRFVNNVFALEDVNHHSYRSMEDAWANTIESRNNYLLNLSDDPLPSDYPMPPSGWTVLQGQAARDYWANARDSWISQHADSGAGNDSLTGTDANNSLEGHGGNDVLTGGAGNDTILGRNGDDTLDGGTGDDDLCGGFGDDLLDGGAGSDFAIYGKASSVMVNLSLTSAQDTGRGTDTLLNVENISSGSGNDHLTGNTQANILTAGAGDDVLNGGTGDDSLTGGNGADSFVFNSVPNAGNVDRIADFTVVDDTVQLDNAVFVGLSEGALSSDAFRANATGLAADSTDRILYETDTGKVFFDTDGNGSGASVLFATLNSSLALTNLDFLVV